MAHARAGPGALRLVVLASAALLGALGQATDDPFMINAEAYIVSQDSTCEPLVASSYPAITDVGIAEVLQDFKWVVHAPSSGPSEPDTIVFALSAGASAYSGGQLFRSEQNGKPGTWKSINKGLIGALNEVEMWALSNDEHELGIVNVYVNQDFPNHVFIQGADKYHWTTFDYGVTFNKVDSPGGLNGSLINFKTHPRQPNFMLAGARSAACYQPFPPRRGECYTDIYLTKDFGTTWTSLMKEANGTIASFVDFDWGAALTPDGSPASKSYSDNTIFATIYGSVMQNGGQNADQSDAGEYVWDTSVKFVQSNDFFASEFKSTVPCGNSFQIISGKIWLAIPSNCEFDVSGNPVPEELRGDQGTVQMYVSSNFGESFQRTCIPVEHMGDTGYKIYPTHDERGAMLLVDHEEDTFEEHAPVYNIYTLGATASIAASQIAQRSLYFSLSAERVYAPRYGKYRLADFHRVEGMPGIFIINQLMEDAVPTLEQDWNSFLQTLITFDNGGEWAHIPPPTTFRNPKCDLCTLGEPCHLHLHGLSSWVTGINGRPALYSQSSAPGTIMASGNTGSKLVFEPEKTCTWLSTDGGLTWQDVAVGMFIFEWGDHGNLLVMAKHRNQGVPTDEVFYSYDSGLCWHSVKLGRAMYLENIRVEPQGGSNKFIIHGEQCYSEDWPGLDCGLNRWLPASTGIAYSLDFGEVMPDWTACTESDFEAWSPPAPEMCLLGQNYTFLRRRRASRCFDVSGASLAPTAQPCACSVHDLECDYGYARDPQWSVPVCRSMEKIPESRACPVARSIYPMSASKLRFVYGDQCVDPCKFLPDAPQCNLGGTSPFESSAPSLAPPPKTSSPSPPEVRPSEPPPSLPLDQLPEPESEEQPTEKQPEGEGQGQQQGEKAPEQQPGQQKEEQVPPPQDLQNLQQQEQTKAPEQQPAPEQQEQEEQTLEEVQAPGQQPGQQQEPAPEQLDQVEENVKGPEEGQQQQPPATESNTIQTPGLNESPETLVAEPQPQLANSAPSSGSALPSITTRSGEAIAEAVGEPDGSSDALTAEAVKTPSAEPAGHVRIIIVVIAVVVSVLVVSALVGVTVWAVRRRRQRAEGVYLHEDSPLSDCHHHGERVAVGFSISA